MNPYTCPTHANADAQDDLQFLIFHLRGMVNSLYLPNVQDVFPKLARTDPDFSSV